MSIVFHLPTAVPLSNPDQVKIYRSKVLGSPFNSPFFFLNFEPPWSVRKSITTNFQTNSCFVSKSSFVKCVKDNYQPLSEERTLSEEWGNQDQGKENLESPWEGAIIYKRNIVESHVEYCTTLERLGLGRLSTEVSKARASEMGLRVTKAVKDYTNGTPVQISVDVTKMKKRFRLDGIVKTVITLTCNRCGDPAAESIFSNFTLLLNDEPIAEPDTINMGVIYGEDKVKTYNKRSEEDEGRSIDLEDQLHFPPEEREIDISKNIRDMLHLEITIDAVCDPGCKGMCLKCGVNFNIRSCNCGKEEVKKKSYGPLGNLRRQMAES